MNTSIPSNKGVHNNIFHDGFKYSFNTKKMVQSTIGVPSKFVNYWELNENKND